MPGVHIAYPPKALELLEMEPTNKYLLRGLIEKVKIGSSSLNLVDIYGVLLGARLLVPKDERSVNPDDLKLSHQRVYLDEGKQPMPIYTAVRHEIPGVGAENEVNTTIDDNEKQAAIKKDEHEGEAWFQWFEISPYEVYCEDLEGMTLVLACMPTIGRFLMALQLVSLLGAWEENSRMVGILGKIYPS